MRNRVALLAAVLGAFGAWAPFARAAVPSSGTVTLLVTPLDVWAPVPITGLTLSTSTEGSLIASWTAPHEDAGVAPSGDPVVSYELRYATWAPVNVGSVAVWFGSASLAATPSPSAPGSAESVVLAGLSPGVTYFIAIRSFDEAGQPSALDAAAASASPVAVRATAIPPGTPQGLTASVVSTTTVALAWTDIPSGQKGSDFAGYRVYRAQASGGAGVLVGVSTVPAFSDSTATPGVFWRWHVRAYDGLGLESPPSATADEDLATTPPAPPFGLTVQVSSPSIVLRWTEVTQYGDGRPFKNPAAPTLDELNRYVVERSTSEPDVWTPIAVLGPGATTYTATDVANAAYRVIAGHGLATSFASNQVGRGGDIDVVAGSATLRVPAVLAATLEASANPTGRDIVLFGSRDDASIGGSVFESVTFTALADGVDPVAFFFSEPVLLEIPYRVQAGLVVPSVAGLGALAAGPAASIPAPLADQSLGVYWNNGAKWVRLYGRIDPVNQVATVRTPVLGTFQLRPLARSAGVEFELNGLSARILTPNGDGKNDVIRFTMNNPRDSSVEGRIFDLTGAAVADLGVVGGVCDQLACVLTWDGKSSGRAVSGGVYIYEIRAEDKVFNGTVVVAR